MAVNNLDIKPELQTPAVTLHRYDNAQTWYGPDMAKRTDWIYELSQQDIAEIDAAVAKVQKAGIGLVELTQDDFPLPTLASRIEEIGQEVKFGRGFFLIRGVPTHRYSRLESGIAFRGIGTYIGEAVSQNAKGHILGHVKNLGLDASDPDVRNYQTNVRINYHTDFSDIVGLMCLQKPESGGLSTLVSSTTVWNELLARRPDLIKALMEPFNWTRWGEIPEGKSRGGQLPVFMPGKERVVSALARTAYAKAEQLPGIPKMTALQLEALDVVDALAADPRLYLDMEFRVGDIQLVNNHTVYHCRTHFVDFPDPDKRRHLLRLWLACDDGLPLPDWYTQRDVSLQGATRTGRPNGIRVPGVPFTAPLEAE